MFDLDFGYFNILDSDRRGLFSQKLFLERMAPVFFAPRVEKLIEIPDLQARGCNINLPLGAGNLAVLEQETRQAMAEKSLGLINDYGLSRLAVDRGLKKRALQGLLPAANLTFGDCFIKAMAAALVARMLSRRELKKIIIVGELENPLAFTARLCQYGLPVSMQSYHPARYEILSYKLLYEKGYPFATSWLDPGTWERGDLALVFDGENLPGTCNTEAFCLRLDNASRGWAPQLENELEKGGIPSTLNNLAPIVESCLWSQAGFSDRYSEQARSDLQESDNEADNFARLEALGDSIGLWDIFLATPAV
ncbi:MAG: hypothetical protein ACM3PE_01695 [Deltaproteobacteria bacterium]